MPWSAESFKKKHNHGLSSAQAERAAATANAVLERTGSEESAIRIANAQAKKHPASQGRYRSGGKS